MVSPAATEPHHLVAREDSVKADQAMEFQPVMEHLHSVAQEVSVKEDQAMEVYLAYMEHHHSAAPVGMEKVAQADLVAH